MNDGINFPCSVNESAHVNYEITELFLEIRDRGLQLARFSQNIQCT